MSDSRIVQRRNIHSTISNRDIDLFTVGKFRDRREKRLENAYICKKKEESQATCLPTKFAPPSADHPGDFFQLWRHQADVVLSKIFC